MEKQPPNIIVSLMGRDEDRVKTWWEALTAEVSNSVRSHYLPLKELNAQIVDASPGSALFILHDEESTLELVALVQQALNIAPNLAIVIGTDLVDRRELTRRSLSAGAQDIVELRGMRYEPFCSLLERATIRQSARRRISTHQDYQLSASRAEVRLLTRAFDVGSEGRAITDDTGERITYCNDAFRALTDCFDAELPFPNPLFDGVRSQRTWRAKARDAIERRREVTEHLKFGAEGSDKTRLDVSMTPLPDESGRVAHFAIRVADVTRRVELEKQLRQAQKMEALGTLAGGIAHDFNNLLSPIVGYAEMLFRRGGLDEKQEKYLRTIHRAGERSRKLVAQILHFSRYQEDDREIVDCKEIAAEAIDVVEAQTKGNVDFTITSEGNVNALANSTNTMQILLNVIANAAQAIGDAEGQIIVSLGDIEIDHLTDIGMSNPVRPGRFIDIVVQDDGPGMDVETKKRIFDPFFTTKGIGEGTGMGLSEVQGLVANHGGAISAESQRGKGSTFRILLPAAPLHRSEITVDPLEETVTSVGTRLRILVIEDNDDVSAVTKEMLEELGYRVDLARTGAEGIQQMLIPHNGIDLVICDHRLSDTSSIAVIEAIRNSGSKVRILAASGASDPELLEEVQAAGAHGLIAKPFRLQQLSKAIRSAMDLDD